MKKNSYTFKLTAPQQQELENLLRGGNYRAKSVPYTRIAVEGPDYNVALYTSGKCLVQGKGAADWVTFTLEPYVLKEVVTGYDKILHPEAIEMHMGIDESGKGDFFGPLVIAAVYTDEAIATAFQEMDVRDSKTISSDAKAEKMAEAIRKILKGRFAIVKIGPEAYNRLYSSIQNVNRLLAWGHARAIENLLEKVPDCPKAIADQFGPKQQIEKALLKKGRKITLVQRHKAEADPAVAAASILARDGFLQGLKAMGEQYKVKIPKGASDQVRAVAREMVQKHGPGILVQTCKCHFKTADAVLAELNMNRAALGPLGQAVSKDYTRKTKEG